MSSILTDLQDLVVAELQGDSDLSGVNVVTEDLSDSQQRILEILESRGLAVTVRIGELGPFGSAGEMPVTMQVLVRENVPVNQSQGRTKISCHDALTMVIAVLHDFDPGNEIWQMLSFSGATRDDQPPLLTYTASFTTSSIFLKDT